MSVADKLIQAGAECVGGDLILNNKSMGHFRDGDFHISAEGLLVHEDLEKQRVESLAAAARESMTVEDLEVGSLELEPATGKRARKAKGE